MTKRELLINMGFILLVLGIGCYVFYTVAIAQMTLIAYYEQWGGHPQWYTPEPFISWSKALLFGCIIGCSIILWIFRPTFDLPDS